MDGTNDASTRLQDAPPNQDSLGDYFIKKYPYTGVVAAVLYLIIVKFLLPKYMEKRPPYKLKTVMMIYNIYQVYINALIFKRAIQLDTLKFYMMMHCRLGGFENGPLFYGMADNCSLYSWIKILDLLDTVFIVLKKKQSQLTFLHLFHHTMVVSIVFISFSEKEQVGYIIVILNSFVHMFMYAYYLLASIESMKWVSAFKNHITQLQLTQFLLILLFFIYSQICGCQWGKRTLILWYFTLTVLIYQFSMFYYNEYIVKKKKK